MRIKSLFIAALAAISVSALSLRQDDVDADAPRYECGTPPPTPSQLAVAADFARVEAAESPNVTLARRQEGIIVDVYLHVVSISTLESDGYASDATLAKQINVLNDAFRPHGISFILKGTSRTVRANWANGRDELGMKMRLNKGSYKTLNLYYLTSLRASTTIGYCYLPDGVEVGSEPWIRDGCVINAGTLPGGKLQGVNLGYTTVHEVGHWFGLLHTFQGETCDTSKPGDMIADTPQQSSQTTGCPSWRDTCPKDPGQDPFHNYMDYSDDRCYEEFTKGQETRMYSQWRAYRQDAE